MKVSAIIVTRGDVDLQPVLESLPVGWEVIIWDNGAGVVTLHQVDFGHLPIPPKGETITVTKMTDPARLGRFAAVVPLGGKLDLSVYGRYAAIEHASHDLIYVQDDDCVVSDPQAIVDTLWLEGEFVKRSGERTDRYGPRKDVVACNMPQEFRHDGYTDSALVGFGAAFHRDAPARAFDRVLYTLSPGPLSIGRIGTGLPTPITEAEREWFYRTCDVVFTTLTPRVLVDVPKVNREFAEDASRMYRQPGHVEERARMLELARQVRDA